VSEMALRNIFFFGLVFFLPGVLVYLWDFFGLRAASEKAAARAIAGAAELAYRAPRSCPLPRSEIAREIRRVE